ncbi:hypothetical protein [Streptomyces sp. NPDC054854]
MPEGAPDGAAVLARADVVASGGGASSATAAEAPSAAKAHSTAVTTVRLSTATI